MPLVNYSRVCGEEPWKFEGIRVEAPKVRVQTLLLPRCSSHTDRGFVRTAEISCISNLGYRVEGMFDPMKSQ